MAKETDDLDTWDFYIHQGATFKRTLTPGTGIGIVNSGGGITISGNNTRARTTKSANYTITSADCIILCNTSGGAFNLTLPAPSDGKFFEIKDITGSFNTNNLTIVRNGSEKIEGLAASFVLQANWSHKTIYSNGTDWFFE